MDYPNDLNDDDNVEYIEDDFEPYIESAGDAQQRVDQQYNNYDEDEEEKKEVKPIQGRISADDNFFEISPKYKDDARNMTQIKPNQHHSDSRLSNEYLTMGQLPKASSQAQDVDSR